MRSPAKINWTLRVLGRRTDGYHEIESLVSPVSLYDHLTFERSSRLGVELSCDRTDVPTDGNNLIVRAARLMAAEALPAAGIRCHLVKRIPLGGGLGGGSSNAAATLMALNRLWGLDWPTDRLARLGTELGSDVPLFLAGGPVIMSGRGEHIEPVQIAWQGWVTLIFPGVPVATAAVYKAWRPSESSDADLSCFTGSSISAKEWMQRTFNMLERPAMAVCPLLKELVDRFAPIADRPVRVSGSGSTLFTAFDEQEEADAFCAAVRARTGLSACMVRPIQSVEAEPALSAIT